MPSRTNSCCIQPNLNNICNTIDCSLLNNPSSDSTKPNDQCELFLYEEQEENKPSITSLATTTSLELQEQEETLESKANNLYYCFANTEEFNSFNPNPHSKLFIQREQGDLKETLMTLSNYRFYLEEINQDSNNANNHLKNHSNNSFNDINQDFNNPNHTNNHTNINHFNANMNTDSNNLSINNHLNPNQDSLAIQANLESKDSTPSTYTLQTILQKDKAYSTLGIELKSPKAIETYNNNGNFSIKLTNINLQDIQSQSNNTLTKDSPLFIYIQDYKLNFITKLKDKQTTIKIPLDTTITKDKYNNINLQDTKLLFLSFIPFKDNDEANNTKAQKIQIESKDLEKQSITKQFKIPIIEDFKENEVVRGWRDEEDLNEIEVVGKKSIKITNSKGEYLFTIENKEIQKDILEVKDLYNYEGIQWFETSAEKYHKLLDVNPKLKDKEKCEKLGVLYFTWREIVEFALIDRYSFQYNPYGNGNWKAVENGAKGYILVSMEGIPYWADAVGQIPYAIDIYRKKLSDTKSKDLSRKIVIQKGYEYGNGLPFIGYDDSNSYDNAMILRGVNWAEKNFDIDDAGIKNNNIKASLLRLDSQGRIIHE